MIQIPDHPSGGERFCRKCERFRPHTDFHNGKRRRYECREHSRNGRRKNPSVSQKQRVGSDISFKLVAKKAIIQVWHAAYTDCRALFGQMTVGVSQKELCGLFENFGLEPSTEFRLVPIDPSEPMVIGNARLVPKKTRIKALKEWSVLKRFGNLEEEDSDVNPRYKYMAVLQLECVENPCSLNSRDLVKKDLDEVDDEPCSKPVVDLAVEAAKDPGCELLDFLPSQSMKYLEF